MPAIPGRERVPATRAPSGSRRPSGDRALRAEIRRKLLHAATAVIPLVAWHLPRSLAIAVLGAIVAAALAAEWARARVPWVRYRFLRLTRRLLRSRERASITGATYIAIAFFLAFVIFPLPVAICAMLYCALGDAAAALIGRRWGRIRIRSGKSWEGAGAGFVVNLSIGLAIPGIGSIAALSGALVASTLEFSPLPVDDNLGVTLGGGSAIWIAIALQGAI